MIHARSLRAAAVALLLVSVAAAASAEVRTLKTVEFPSPAVGRTMKYGIGAGGVRHIRRTLSGGVPAARAHATTPCGGGGTAEACYAGLYGDLIIVMPDAGNSWYVNWATRRGRQKNRWEDDMVQATCRTRGRELPDDRAARGTGHRWTVDGWLRWRYAGAQEPRPVHLDRQHQRGARARAASGRAGCAATEKAPTPQARTAAAERRRGAGRTR